MVHSITDSVNSKSNFERHWWRVWYCFVALAVLWLAWCGSLSRPSEKWANGWVGWWTGDRMGSKPLWTFGVFVEEGSAISLPDGNPALETPANQKIGLGHWREKRPEMTWAGWIRVRTTDGIWPSQFLVVREAESRDLKLLIGFEDGKPKAEFLSFPDRTNDSFHFTISLIGPDTVKAGEWVHLAVSTDGKRQRIIVNGRSVSESLPLRRHPQFFLSKHSLTCMTAGPDQSTVPVGTIVEQDDVVLYDRAVPPDELAALASHGRGAWAEELDRSSELEKWWKVGLPATLLTMAVLILVRLLQRVPVLFEIGKNTLFNPAYQTIRWTLAVGTLITGVTTALLAVRAEHEEQRRFDEVLFRFRKDTEAYWERVAGLVAQARDWLGSQTNLSPVAWDNWLHSNRFPQAYPGVIGVGYAQQVRPADIAAHEAEWSARLGFDYRIHPSIEVERQPIVELEGDPRLPVVLFETRTLDPAVLRTNNTILGRDLLFQSMDDLRPWSAARRIEESAARNEVQTSSLEEIAPPEWFGRPVTGIYLFAPTTLRTKLDVAWDVLPSRDWRGVTFASVDVTRMTRELLGMNESPIGFRLATASSRRETHDQIVDSSTVQPSTADRPASYRRGTAVIPFFYRRLLMEAWSTPAFEAQSLRRWPKMLAATGIAITLLIATLLLVQVRAREAQQQSLAALHRANNALLIAHREREIFSRDLHDGSIQSLYALGLHLQRTMTLPAAASEPIHGELERSISMLDQSIIDLRRFILDAKIEGFTERTITDNLNAMIERLRRVTETEFELRVDSSIDSISTDAGVQVINIVREAVSNALRHAEAKHILISLERAEPHIDSQIPWRLMISDDGHGFDSKHVNGKGRGLKNVNARAVELAGRCEIQSSSGNGTRIVVKFSQPCNPSTL